MFSPSWKEIITNVLEIRRKNILKLIDYYENKYIEKDYEHRQEFKEFSDLHAAIVGLLCRKGAELCYIEFGFNQPWFGFKYLQAENLYTWLAFHDYFPEYSKVEGKRSYETNIGTFFLNQIRYFNGDLMSKLNLLTISKEGLGI